MNFGRIKVKMRPEFIETVCFLGVEDSNGNIKPRATAFYVVVPFKHNRLQGRGYLVTARHNIEAAGQRRMYASINEGLLGTNRTPQWLPIEAERWYVDDDPTIDVAIADWRPEHSRSYLGVLTDNFIEGSPEGGSPFVPALGMETATIGLFHHHAGTDQHSPILRSGNVAALPVDKVKTKMGSMKAYLIEARSVGGLSGSPVFIGEDVYHGEKRQPLLGLIHGHFDWKDEISSKQFQPIQTGVAIVTPSSAILSILYQEELKSKRVDLNCIF